MDYVTAFEISASGMAAEKVRLDTLAMNLANANTTRAADGGLYKPLRVITAARTSQLFEGQMAAYNHSAAPAGVDVVAIRAVETQPRLVYDPGHPQADDRGFVAYPNINPVTEMVSLMETVRAYEANVRAMNAAKTMALRALDIGR